MTAKTDSGKGNASGTGTSSGVSSRTVADKGSSSSGQQQQGQTPASASGTKPSTLSAASAETDGGPIPRSTSWRRLSSLDIIQQHPGGANTAKANGQAGKPSDLTRTDSLTVPGSSLPPRDHHVHMQDDETGGRDTARSQRRGSRRSVDSGMSASGSSAVDLAKLQASQAASGVNKEGDDQGKSVVTTDDSYLRSAIPSLPLGLAILCLMVNVFVPGCGTILSGISVFCCGRPRVKSKDDQMTTTFCVSVWVGMAQLFTVPLMLVGWFWSLTWGIYMVILAVERRNEERQHREKQIQALALTALSSQVRPWTLRT